MLRQDLRIAPHDNKINDGCIMCKSNTNIIIPWSQCRHRYCLICIKRIITQHVSLSNQIPKCLYTNCGQSLNTLTFHQQDLYPTKYKITIPFQQYENMDKLINGYIRTINKHFVPNDIILLIFDYYHLHYAKHIKCDQCLSNSTDFSPFMEHMTLDQALKLQVGHKIDHRDLAGLFIEATIIEKKGTNLKIQKQRKFDGWLHKWDIWSDFSVELYRFAAYKSISARPTYPLSTSRCRSIIIDINPRRKHCGWKSGEIRRIDSKSGQVQVCYNHNDKQYLYWVHLDNKLEIRNRINCECVLTIDFNKLCNKQSFCIKCKEYYPNNCIIYWSKCNHILCIKCLMSDAEHQIRQNKIPICPAINCQQEIAQNECDIDKHNIAFLCDSWPKSNEYTLLKERLKLLLFRKDRFECSYCRKWHKNIDLFVNKTGNCDHKYSNECHKYLRLQSDCAHSISDCLQCLSECEVCQIVDENRCLIAWTKCGHKYHKKCATKYINEWMSTHASIIGSISGLMRNKDDMIPLCIHKQCNQLLNVLCAQKIGVTHYQCQALYVMRKESILIDDNNDKPILFNLDFA